MSTSAALATSKARLPAELPARDYVDLETGIKREWHPRTVAFWGDIRKSPIAKELIQVDLHGLFILVELVDDYHWTRKPALLPEIRLQRQCFGLTPIDRRRLQWEIKPKEPRRRARAERPAGPAAGSAAAVDPRSILSIVS